MSSLAEFQDAFGAALARPVTSGELADPATMRALSIHRNTALKASQDALTANYPVIRALFGEDAFAACALTFATLAPPSAPCLNAYGEGFPEFLASYVPAMAVPYASDVARVERLVTEALFVADAAVLGGADLAADLNPLEPLALHPAVRFVAFAFPAASLWLAHQAEAAETLADIVWAPDAVLVTRPVGAVRVQRLAPGGLEFLTACAAGKPLAAAALSATRAGGDLTTLFSSLITAGAFA